MAPAGQARRARGAGAGPRSHSRGACLTTPTVPSRSCSPPGRPARRRVRSTATVSSGSSPPTTSATRGAAGAAGFTGTSFAHLGFMTKLAGNLRRGGTSFIMSRWSARGSLALLAEQRMTTVAGVPAQLALMLRDPDFDRYDLDSVRFIVVGGGPVTPGLAEEARTRFRAALATRYSCTEAGIGLGTAFDDPDEDAVVSVGRPHPAVELAPPRRARRAGPSRRGRGGVPAVSRGDDRLLARPRRDARRVHRRRVRPHR